MGIGIALTTLPIFNSIPATGRGEPLMVRDVSHLFGDERIVLLHHTMRHEPAHLRDFREAALHSMQTPPTG